MTRTARRIFIRKIPGFTSAGHAILVLVYVVINLALTFTGFDKSSPTNFAARFGWFVVPSLMLLRYV